MAHTPLKGVEILKLPYKIFHMCNKRLHKTSLSFSPNAPVWYNPCLGELYKLSEAQRWVKFGLKYAHQLFFEQYFKSFLTFRVETGIPLTYRFFYMQLGQTGTTQFGLQNVHLQPSKLENLLIDRDRAKFILKILLPYTV